MHVEWNFFDRNAEPLVTKRNLPHVDMPGHLTFLTFRLADSMPREVVERWHHETESWLVEHPNSVSEPKRLEAGKRYAIRGIMVDGFKGLGDTSKGDHFAVTWQMPGDEPPKPGDAPIPDEYLEFEVK